jgi:predicted DCC family thiol-disulfide oxidoreductase YuxK
MGGIKVYYNSACPVCSAVDLETVRERLHVRHADGSIRIGTDAFVALFARTRGQKSLARLLALPVIRPLARLAYNGFARGLYSWNRAKGRW